jgi:hypothetical protein|tara:strand:+ start:230 stop:619 length:390 start_codon:yes stop_codon:yes gene_type:complete
MFDTVTRNKIRFNTNKGMVSVEDLWDMPLQAKNNFDLDTVAKAIAADIRKNDEDSFIATATKSSVADVLKLDVVKHIIAFKIAENAAKTKRVGDAARRAQLQTAIADKSEDALKNMSVAELEAEMALLK